VNLERGASVPDADDVEYREADGIAYLTLNRPAKLNALGPNSFRLLGEHITRFAGSPSAGVAILHGNGGSFAAGADIEHYVGLSVLEYADFMRTGNATQQMLIDCPKPVIAAVHGVRPRRRARARAVLRSHRRQTGRPARPA
jgi:enoyl-CoA hydratase/carnithine racemase